MTVRHITSGSSASAAANAYRTADDGSGRTLIKGRQTKAAIVDAALGLASTIGLEGLTIGALAEVPGMSTAVVFPQFGSTGELDIAVNRTSPYPLQQSFFFATLLF